MKKLNFSVEILCLFFIISISILFGKVLLDVRTAIGAKINQFMPQPTIQVEYQAYSYKDKDVIDKLDKLTIIKNVDELENFKNKLKEEKIEVNWLDNKIKNYEKDYFKEKTLVVICIVNDNNILSTRISGVSKKNSYITIGITKKVKSYEATKQYTWLAVLEVKDTESKIDLDISNL